MSFNASVTVDKQGRLTLGSLVTIESDGSTIAFNEVPCQAEVGGIMFWPRVNDALKEVDWRVVKGGGYQHDAQAGVIRFHAQPNWPPEENGK